MITTADSPPRATNADPTELDKFSALAAHWWDLQGEFKPLHAINPLRLAWLVETAGQLHGKKILDVGCGGGILAESMAAAGAEVTGIDLSEKSLAVARLHGLESAIKVNYRAVSVEELAGSEPERYDIVTCMEMLEHVPDPASVVQACATLTRPGGWACFSTLNRNAKSFFLAIIGAEYMLRLLPRGTHTYEQFIKPSELSAAARRAGLTPIGIRGITYHPLAQTYTLSSDASINYLMFTRK